MDKARIQITSFTRRENISDAKAQEALINGAPVSEEQVSSCAIKISFGGFHEIVFFPFPVDGTRTRLRVARRSHYIEVITTPISETNSPGDVLVNQLPTILDGTSLMLRNIHRINLDRLPTIDTSDKVCLKKWLPMHISFSLSDRETSMPSVDEEANQDNSHTLMAMKKTLCKLFLECTGV
ncbi:hypothetical protein EWM64_g3332 [Hericium alpestre]|uniref:Uncharacterized protein n=1 Tax=Hericium alpestre TaxID=135208 RepID=A0A4Z0A378_9AGAM|nr:hypothetical protein EWM64_g3332 [Hericium alpestre]